jgi:hypothetical protein
MLVQNVDAKILESILQHHYIQEIAADKAIQSKTKLTR